MKTLIVGHRGSGKSVYLQSLDIPESQKIDLDIYIQNLTKKTIGELVASYDWDFFRDLEVKTLLEILDNSAVNKNCYIAVGAGFSWHKIKLEIIKQKANLLWVVRDNDGLGRIFLDPHRPRLRPDIAPLEEYHLYYQQREEVYKSLGALIVSVPNGLQYEKVSSMEKIQVNADITLLPEHITHENTILNISRRYIEIRDDIWDEFQTAGILNIIDIKQHQRIIYSIRKQPVQLYQFLNNLKIDAPLELESEWKNSIKEIFILSCHEYAHEKETISECLARLENHPMATKAKILKASIIIENFEQLEIGWKWHVKNKDRHCFLPRSPRGNTFWSWFRILTSVSMPLNFIRLGRAPEWAMDWPTLLEMYLFNQNTEHLGFGCILGAGVKESLSPLYHHQFCLKQGWSMLAIELDRIRFTLKSILFLMKLGLRFAAITAPLKNIFYDRANELGISLSEKSHRFKAINTLIIENKTNKRKGDNTDWIGFAQYNNVLNINNEKLIYIWGGGGTLEMIKYHLPHATHFSTKRDKDELKSVKSPEVVIWAAGMIKKDFFPPSNWKPQIVIDLSYTQNSSGLEYAQILGNVKYYSGILMFHAQANAQQGLIGA